jgi:hypothetical protein
MVRPSRLSGSFRLSLTFVQALGDFAYGLRVDVSLFPDCDRVRQSPRVEQPTMVFRREHRDAGDGGRVCTGAPRHASFSTASLTVEVELLHLPRARRQRQVLARRAGLCRPAFSRGARHRDRRSHLPSKTLDHVPSPPQLHGLSYSHRLRRRTSSCCRDGRLILRRVDGRLQHHRSLLLPSLAQVSVLYVSMRRSACASHRARANACARTTSAIHRIVLWSIGSCPMPISCCRCSCDTHRNWPRYHVRLAVCVPCSAAEIPAEHAPSWC